jgi:diacylglycerol O-acyltransferase/trehalose O-mycolyltransferase
MRFKAVLLVMTLLFSGLMAAPASAREDVATVVGEQVISTRLLELQVHSDALNATVGVRLLLPKDWAKYPHRTWPTLYLLHGATDDYRSWTDKTDITAFTADTDALIVMPDAGVVGFYSNWYNAGQGGAPAWETFHLTELRRLLEKQFRAGSQRAVAGLSMGGFGALSYAARHPGFFRAAASYSGVVNTTYANQTQKATDLIQGYLVGAGFDKDALWGDPVAQARIWAAHNPYDLAARLRCTPVFISVGNGQVGPLDPPGASPDPLEAAIGEETGPAVAHFRAEHVSVTTDLYGPGTHSWPYWQRELHKSFPMLMRAIGAGFRTPVTAG